MALIIISGHPSSGKTHRASQLHAAFSALIADPPSSEAISTSTATSPPPAKRPPPNLHLPAPISDHGLYLPRVLYSTAATEKTLRASLYSAVKRAIGRNAVVILDSGNYIKGWRYQLYCEAKAVGVRSCVVHVGVGEEAATGVNEQRLAGLKRDGNALSSKNGEREADGVTTALDDLKLETPKDTGQAPGEANAPQSHPSKSVLDGPEPHDPYSPALHADLCARYEEPNAAARWDSPLYTVLWDDESPPVERIWREVVLGIKADGKSMGEVRMNAGTVLTPSTPPSFLHTLDRATQAVLRQITAYQAAHPDDLGGTLAITPPTDASSTSAASPSSQTLQLHLPIQNLSMPHLQRLRRQFTQLQRQQVGGQGMGAIGAGVTRASSSIGGGADPENDGRSVSERVSGLFVDWLNDRFEGGG